MAFYPRSGCTARTTFQLVGPQAWTAVPAALVYDSVDPFAVRVRFGDCGPEDMDSPYDVPDDDGGVEWLLSRDLLRAGLTGPVGEGDVRLWPARGGAAVVFLQLRAPSGEALFELSPAGGAHVPPAAQPHSPLRGQCRPPRVGARSSAPL